MFLGHASQIEDRVAQTSQSGVDADILQFGNLLERESLVEAHQNDFLLVLWQELDQVTDIAHDLRVRQLVLVRRIAERAVVEDIETGLRSTDVLCILLLAIDVGYQIVGNAEQEAEETAFLVVVTRLDGHNDFRERILEEVFRQFTILHDEVNVGVQLVLVAEQQFVKRLIDTLCVEGDELIVGKIFHLVSIFSY